MKLVFHKATRQWVGTISYCPDGQEGNLIGLKQEDVVVKTVDDFTPAMQRVLDPEDETSYEHLTVSLKNDIEVQPVKKPHLLIRSNPNDILLMKMQDQSLRFEERFEALVEYVVNAQPHKEVAGILKRFNDEYNSRVNGKDSDKKRSQRVRKTP